MEDWHFSPRCYRHFDKPLSADEIRAIVQDPIRVAAHPFFPLICFEKRYDPFRRSVVAPKKKKRRLIRYAARTDASIFSYYRHQLAPLYERMLRELDISDCVLAYRKIPVTENNSRGKCNIHFANEAFQAISKIEDCCAVALDISSYFENIDHARLKKLWCRLLGLPSLPKDHYAVFKAITKYSTIGRDELYERLGYLILHDDGPPEYTVPRREIPMQLCSPADFRKKVCGEGKGYNSLIKLNESRYGIPQGAPISDLLANLYLLDFDGEMASYARQRRGYYFRYSDDILLIVPGDGRAARAAREYTQKLITKYGEQLCIKPEKCQSIRFRRSGGRLSASEVAKPQNRLGLEYLGFRFDGLNIYVRNGTISGLRRRMRRSVRSRARSIIARYRGKDCTFLTKAFDIDLFLQRFGRVPEFELNQDYRKWTFWTYAKRAGAIFGDQGSGIYKQLTKNRDLVSKWLDRDLTTLLASIKIVQSSTRAGGSALSGINPA